MLIHFMPSQIIGVYTAQFPYSAGSPQELTLAEGDVVYLFEKGDDGWWTAKKRIPGSPNDEPTGLVPHNFVAPSAKIGSAKALYNYDAQTTEELSFKEGQEFDIYIQDGDWVLVGVNDKEFGFVPANYIEMVSGVPPPVISKSQDTVDAAEKARRARAFAPPPKHIAAQTVSPTPEADDAAPPPQPARKAASPVVDDEAPPPMPRRPAASERDKDRVEREPSRADRPDRTSKSSKSSSRPKERRWNLQNVDRKGSTDVIISDKEITLSPRNGKGEKSWEFKDLLSYSTEKKHLFLELQNPRASVDLRADSRDVTEQILAAISAVASGYRGGGGLTEVLVAANSAGNKNARISIDFVAANPREVSVREGEIVFLLNKSNKDWWLVRTGTGQEGMVPAHIVELEDDAKSLAKRVWPFKGKSKEKEKERQREHEREKARERSERERAERDRSERRRSRERERDRDLDREPSRRELDRRQSHRESGVERQKSTREHRPKPDPHKVRTWTDRSGNFRVDAALLGVAEGKIHLHKVNGVKIAVPANKLSPADLNYVEGVTGVSLEDDKPLVDIKRSKSKSDRASHPPSGAAPASSGSASDFDWFEFFLSCGVDLKNCQRYTLNFTRDRIDENMLPDITPQTLRTFGLSEGDILRVTKKISEKYGSKSTETTPVPETRSQTATPLVKKFDDDAWASKDTPAVQESNPQATQPQTLQPQPTAPLQPVRTQPTGPIQPVSTQPTGSLADLLGFTQASQTSQPLQPVQPQVNPENIKLKEQQAEQERQILKQQSDLQMAQLDLLKQQQEHYQKQKDEFLKIQKTGEATRAALGPFATGVAQQSTGNFGSGFMASTLLGQQKTGGFQPQVNTFQPQTTGFPSQVTGGALPTAATGNNANIFAQPIGSQTTGPFGAQNTGGPFTQPVGSQNTGGPFRPQVTGPLQTFPTQTTGAPFQGQTQTGIFQPQVTGPFQTQATGPFQSQATGPFQPQVTGPFQAQATSSFQPQAATFQSQATGPFQSQATGPFQSQATGPFQSQPTGPFQSQATGPFQTQATGPFQSQNAGIFQSQAPSSSFQAQNTGGPFRPQVTGPFQSQATGGGFQPQSTNGPFQSQATGPFQPQITGPFQAQASAPFNQQATGGPFSQPFGSQTQPAATGFGVTMSQPLSNPTNTFQTNPTFNQNTFQPSNAGFQPQSNLQSNFQNSKQNADPFGELFKQVTGGGFPKQPTIGTLAQNQQFSSAPVSTLPTGMNQLGASQFGGAGQNNFTQTGQLGQGTYGQLAAPSMGQNAFTGATPQFANPGNQLNQYSQFGAQPNPGAFGGQTFAGQQSAGGPLSTFPQGLAQALPQASTPTPMGQIPLQSQPTGFGFGNQPMQAQNTGKRANINAASVSNPFGF